MEGGLNDIQFKKRMSMSNEHDRKSHQVERSLPYDVNVVCVFPVRPTVNNYVYESHFSVVQVLGPCVLRPYESIKSVKRGKYC